jgi:hypothetical protein
VPFTDRGDEIGTIARNLSDLQSQLAAAAAGCRGARPHRSGAETVVERLAMPCKPSLAAISRKGSTLRSIPNTNPAQILQRNRRRPSFA